MAVVTTWAFGAFKVDVTFNQRINADIENLDNGGYVVSLQGPVSTLLLFIDKNGNSSTAVLSGATNADVTQRADGNVVVVYEKSGETFSQVRALNGASVVAETPVGGPGSSQPSVSECEADAWEHVSLIPGGTQRDIIFNYKLNDEGDRSPEIAVTTGIEDDVDPQVVCLEGGGYAIAWLRYDENVELWRMWRAVYNGDGTVRSGPEVVSGPSSGQGIHLSFDLIPIEDGGFYIEHIAFDEVDESSDVFAARFDANGNQLTSSLGATDGNELGISADIFDSDAPPAVTIALPGEALVLACTSEESGSPNLDVHLYLFDASTGQSLTGEPQTILTGAATGPNVDIAALGVAGGSGIALAYELNGAIVIGRSQLIATTSCDGGDNTVIGGEHCDVVFGRGGNDHIECGGNNDTANLGFGDDFCDGGEGDGDTLDYSGIYGVTIDLDITTPQDTTGGGIPNILSFAFAQTSGALSAGNGIDTILNFENLVGSREGDTLRGDEKVNNIKGMSGDDQIEGRNGNDVLEGGNGNDQLFGGNDQDLLLGGNGDDTLDGGASSILGDTASYAGTKGAVRVDLRIAGPQDTWGGGLDTLIGIENLIGTDANDTLTGNNASRNELRGGNGNDTLFGDLGTDNLFGDAGADVLMGGDGNDRLEGGTGRDVLTGGIGPDRFHYVSASHSGLGNLSDWIMDFNSADGDKIDLTTVYSGTLSYIGEDQFGGTAGQLRVRDKDTFQHVQIDLNGDGASDMDIRLMNGGIAAASDFVL